MTRNSARRKNGEGQGAKRTRDTVITQLLLLNVHFLDKFMLILKHLNEKVWKKARKTKWFKESWSYRSQDMRDFIENWISTQPIELFIYCSPLKTEKNSKGITYQVEVAFHKIANFMVSLKKKREGSSMLWEKWWEFEELPCNGSTDPCCL